MTDDLMLQHLPVSVEDASWSEGATMSASPLASGGSLLDWTQELAHRDVLAAFAVSGEAMACAS